MKKAIIILSLLTIISGLYAEGWQKSGDFNILLSQSYYSDNWAGTEKGNITWTASMNFIMEKQLNKMLHDKNTLLLSFGQTHSQDYDAEGELVWQKPEISTDKIDYENLLTFTLQKYVDPFASFRWESSFYDGSDPDNEFYINPNIITLSAGVKRDLFSGEKQSLDARLGAAWKNFLNQHDDIDYQNNAGAELVLGYWYLFAGDFGKFDSTMRLYQALLTSEDNDNDDWKSLDMEWINNLTLKINSYVGVKVYFEMLYDKEVIDEFRFQENLGINITYALFK